MALDIFCVLVIAFLTITGYWVGIVRQILLIACLIGSFFLSKPAVGYVNAFLCSQSSMSPSVCYVCSCFLAWMLVYIILRIIAFYINRVIGRNRIGELWPWNKRLGALLGAAKGLLIVFVILCLLDVALGVAQQQGVGGSMSALSRLYASSYSGAVMSRINPIARWGAVDRVNTLIEVARHPEVLKGIENEAQIRQLLNRPTIVALANSRSIEEAWNRRDFNAIMASKEFSALMADRELVRLLLNVKLFDILEERAKKAGLAPAHSK